MAVCLGLSPAVTAALRELSLNIPALKKEIADGLLKILSIILMQQPFRHPGIHSLIQVYIPSSRYAFPHPGIHSVIQVYIPSSRYTFRHPGIHSLIQVYISSSRYSVIRICFPSFIYVVRRPFV